MTEWLERDVIITGESVSNAQAGFDQNGQPNVMISLDGEGGMLMSRATRATSSVAWACCSSRENIAPAMSRMSQGKRSLFAFPMMKRNCSPRR